MLEIRKEIFTQKVIEKLTEQGYNVKRMNVKKNNSFLTAIVSDEPTLVDGNKTANALIYVEDFIDLSVDEYIETFKRYNTANEFIGLHGLFDILEDYEKCKKYLRVSLLNYETNKEKVVNIHSRMEDLIMEVYLCDIPCGDNISDIGVTKELAKMWDKSEEDIFSNAVELTFKYNETQVIPLSKMVNEKESSPMYMVKFENSWKSAIAVFTPGLLKTFADFVKGDVLMIPHSVDDFIIMPYIKESVENCRGILQEINKKREDNRAFLSNNLYVYSKENDSVAIC